MRADRVGIRHDAPDFRPQGLDVRIDGALVGGVRLLPDALHELGAAEDPARLLQQGREELVLWDPTARHIYIYTAKPLDESMYSGYTSSPRQYNPRLMD